MKSRPMEMSVIRPVQMSLKGSRLTRGGGGSFRRRRGCDGGRTRSSRGFWQRGSGRGDPIAAL